MPVIAVHIDNLERGGCESIIRHELGELSGVSTVAVDHATARVAVVHDGTVTRDEVTQVLFRLGHPEHGTGRMGEGAMSRASHAIGRVHA